MQFAHYSGFSKFLFVLVTDCQWLYMVVRHHLCSLSAQQKNKKQLLREPSRHLDVLSKRLSLWLLCSWHKALWFAMSWLDSYLFATWPNKRFSNELQKKSQPSSFVTLFSSVIAKLKITVFFFLCRFTQKEEQFSTKKIQTICKCFANVCRFIFCFLQLAYAFSALKKLYLEIL